jgi:Ca2+-dependent lipid-binding protein
MLYYVIFLLNSLCVFVSNSDNLNPNFVKKVRISYLFEIVQELTFRVLDYDSKQKSELIGEARCKLTDILLSGTRSVTLQLEMPNAATSSSTSSLSKSKSSKRGSITIVGDEESYVNWRFLLFDTQSPQISVVSIAVQTSQCS